jgi:uncharacterized membrane protein HdeD (DUF308 family)
MIASPGTLHEFGRTVTRDAAERISRHWWQLLLNGLLLIVSGVLIFSIDWTVRSLATFLGALFILQGLTEAVNAGVDDRVRRGNVLAGVLSIAAGAVIIAWPAPGLVALAIFLGAWLIVVGTLSMSGSLAARRLLPTWWLVLITGLLEVVLGVLALADPGATLAAIVTVGGIWAVAIGVIRVVVSFELKRLPEVVDRALSGTAAAGSAPVANGSAGHDQARTPQLSSVEP